MRPFSVKLHLRDKRTHGQWRRNEFESGDKRIFVVPLNCFCFTGIQLVVLMSAFVMASTVGSASCLLLFCSQRPSPPCPAVCKSGAGHVAPYPMESAPLQTDEKPKIQTDISVVFVRLFCPLRGAQPLVTGWWCRDIGSARTAVGHSLSLARWPARWPNELRDPTVNTTTFETTFKDTFFLELSTRLAH